MSFYEKFKSTSLRTISFVATTFGVSSVMIGLILVRYFGGPSIKRWKMDRAAKHGEDLYQMELQNTMRKNVTLESQ